ncbi:sensor histidine kinase [Spirosoma rhododendri]|uniref:Histidine kinase n=1 Tax=Spirosoma rhododendri TaxID=2728024 RepID=A0A7L5DZW6_9BACT|nr:histidine kinase [Spirosoma rhododendri]QJD81040.1 histidine kinase [Spirosoma rhododendri]
MSHVLTYLINYFSLYVLNIFFAKGHDLPEWTVYRRGGIFGFIIDGNAAVTSILWSYQLVIILIAIRAFRDILQLRTQYYRSEQDRLRLEVDFLKTQVNPHFLFNTLNSVYARIFEADQQAADLVLHLSELMRYNLYETDQPRIGLDKELAYIQNYLDLERNRLSGQDVLIDYEQSGEPTHYQIAPLLLIAFVENAFKHGVKGATQPAYVQVRAEIDPDGHLTFIVENSLPERKQAPTTTGVRSGGVGLVNVRRRLEALYNDQYVLNTTIGQRTYAVTLTVQLEWSSHPTPTAELA